MALNPVGHGARILGVLASEAAGQVAHPHVEGLDGKATRGPPRHLALVGGLQG